MWAAAIISSAGTPVIDSTYSGVYLLTISDQSSYPSVRFSMNLSSDKPSFKITLAIPFNKATSVPGLGRSQISA